MIWANPISDTLWYTGSPIPAYITAVGDNFVLQIPSIASSYQTTTLDDAENQYEVIVLENLTSPFITTPQLPEFSLPIDGQMVLGQRISDSTYFYGTWSVIDETVTQSAEVVPLADIGGWTLIT